MNNEILLPSSFSHEELTQWLSMPEEQCTPLFEAAYEKKKQYFGNKVFIRGLIEISNQCAKNCLYCGIRRENHHVIRYNIPEKEVFQLVDFAVQKGLGSVVIQSGEITSKEFITSIDRLIRYIMKISNGQMGITLSCGEQTEDTYRRWFENGAHRYLLRIEASNPRLYEQIHPADGRHDYKSRLNALYALKKIGYHFGTGVMIGLPFQTPGDLASDLLFMKQLEVDMVGMGPYLEHEHTPLMQYASLLPSPHERFILTLKMIALLRLMMPDINIAATTALQVIYANGRERALTCGANVVMPNITPPLYKSQYNLYRNKPAKDLEAESIHTSLVNTLQAMGMEIAFHSRGDAPHYLNRTHPPLPSSSHTEKKFPEKQ